MWIFWAPIDSGRHKLNRSELLRLQMAAQIPILLPAPVSREIATTTLAYIRKEEYSGLPAKDSCEVFPRPYSR